MTKYWSKAVFYREWQLCIWIGTLLSGSLIYNPLTEMISHLNHLKYLVQTGEPAAAGVGQWFGDLLVWSDTRSLLFLLFQVLLLVIIQFHDLRREPTGDLLASLPFTRRQLVFTKWATGMLTIAVPFLLIYLLLSLFYWLQRDWIIDSYWLIPQWTLLHWMFLACFYSFLFLVQALMGQHVAAGIIGMICTMIPWYLLTTVPVVFRELLGLETLDRLRDLSRYTVWNLVLNARAEYLPPDWTTYQFIYTHFWFRILGMLVVIAGLYRLAEWAYGRNPLERNGQLLMFPFLEPVLIWGFAVCFGLLATLVFGLGYDTGFLVLAAGTALGYWLAKKVVLHYQR